MLCFDCVRGNVRLVLDSIMAILNCNFVTKPHIPTDDPSPRTSPHPRLDRTQLPTTPSPTKLQVKLSRRTQGGGQKPSILEIERAIGAGIFRDRDVNSEDTEGNTERSFDNSVGKGESSVEKKIRDTGEWLTDQAERTSRSAGKQILMAMLVWIVPLWMVGFVVASGIVELPFDIPFLEDLLS